MILGSVRNRWKESRRIKFKSAQEFYEYASAHPECFDSLSPGSASEYLGCTRQHIYELIDRGHLRAWFVYEHGYESHDVPGNRATYVYVSFPDVKAYKVAPKSKGGRPKKVA